ncbi:MULTISPECIES: nucleotide sugar dehydrogenase [unclassified Haladaptatus]|uniref:nucleotide sugar dehydrogenase n=1 Tax=unclassified Haladaptatus TaxID=2622732 RepID=UPI0023E85708|nr:MULTISPECIES: nucleotide sugar dehydrogenase [unclassified Haladaptatus]
MSQQAVATEQQVCVLGLGHVGLPTALLAANSHDVIGVDIDQDHVDALNAGDLPIEEPGMDDLFDRVNGQFAAQTTVPDADIYVIVTPTPVRTESGIADMSYIRAAAEMLVPTLDAGDLVILESTVPPGTTERLIAPILEESGLSVGDFHLAYCPERASPGDTLTEITQNNRVVGGVDESSVAHAVAFYESFVEGAIRTTTPRTAEFVKLMENTFRDVNIALANEFALIAEEFELDVHEATSLANEHPRVNVHHPGPGVGGHCIPVDPQFLSQHATHDRLISLAREVNNSMAGHVIRTIRSALCDDRKATITLFGVAYKADVEDTRKTPANQLVELMESLGYEVRVYDPFVTEFAVDPESLDSAVNGSDCIVVVTDHSEFATLDPESFASKMATKTVVDTRDVIDRKRWQQAGFSVSVLGDGTV